MQPVLRSVLAVIVGVVAGGVLISRVEMLNSRFYPMPAGLNPNDSTAMASYIRDLPAAAFGGVLAGWAIGTFCGAWIAAQIARRKPIVHGAVIGAVFLILGIVNMVMLPHPIWVWVCSIIIFIGCGYAGGRLASGKVAA